MGRKQAYARLKLSAEERKLSYNRVIVNNRYHRSARVIRRAQTLIVDRRKENQIVRLRELHECERVNGGSNTRKDVGLTEGTVEDKPRPGRPPDVWMGSKKPYWLLSLVVMRLKVSKSGRCNCWRIAVVELGTGGYDLR